MYILNGQNMTDRDALWQEIRRVLEVPEYFGNNLDALHDVLGEIEGELRILHACKMLNALGSYGCKLLEVCFDAAQENPRLTFMMGGAE